MHCFPYEKHVLGLYEVAHVLAATLMEVENALPEQIVQYQAL